jgi:3',5'-cyclic AMP phosphodiesterase CpdA
MKLFVNTAFNLIFLLLLISAGLILSGCRALSVKTMTPEASSASSDYFTIAMLPDTQYYSEKYPAIFTQQTQWIAEWAKAQHIVFVSQVGDLVEDYNADEEWKNAQSAMSAIRNAGIPYSVVPGNHDLNFEAGDAGEFDKYFPYTDFTAYPWYGSGSQKKGAPAADFPSGSNASNYETISSLGQNILILNLACTPKVLVNSDLYIWANSVLKYYSEYKAIIVTHGYINTAGDYTDSSNVSGVEIWNNIVNPNSNVVAVICGHIHGAYDASVVAEHGNTVENLLFDSQSDPNGGDGWLRLYKFYPSQNIVSATTYSPYLEQFDNSSTGAFTFSLKMTDSTNK